MIDYQKELNPAQYEVATTLHTICKQFFRYGIQLSSVWRYNLAR